MANLAFERFHNCFLLVQNQHSPTDVEWDQWLTFATQGGRGDAAVMRVLIFSAGGSPTAKQRSRVHELSPKSGNGVLTAVVTASFIGRTVVQAMALFNRNIRAFALNQSGQAFEYLYIPTPLHQELMECVQRLHQRIGIPCHATL